MLKVYEGYDPKDDIAWKVCFNSLLKYSSIDCEVKPIVQSDLRKYNIYRREVDKNASTEFSITRFLVPLLNEYQGWAVYCDCDFLWLDDIHKLIELADPKYAVQVVKHDYNPTSIRKMEGKIQYLYPRKNWSSLVLWNCSHPSNKHVDLELVNTALPMFLHRFLWLSEKEIGEIPLEWNWLVNWYREPEDGHPKALHFTEGGPWIKKYSNGDYSDVWLKEYEQLNHSS